MNLRLLIRHNLARGWTFVNFSQDCQLQDRRAPLLRRPYYRLIIIRKSLFCIVLKNLTDYSSKQFCMQKFRLACLDVFFGQFSLRMQCLQVVLVCLLYISFNLIGQQDSQIQSDSRKYKVNKQVPPVKTHPKLIQKDIQVSKPASQKS